MHPIQKAITGEEEQGDVKRPSPANQPIKRGFMFTRSGIYRGLGVGLFAIVLLLSWQVSFAGPIRDKILARRLAQQQDAIVEENASSADISLPTGVRVERDIPYGSDDRQRMDIYMPQHVVGAPVIFMVHGGAWRLGDKASQAVIKNKVARWVPRGFIFVSVNYRLLPKTAPLNQAEDIAHALAVAQDKATSWGGDPSKFILMGHSAGAHLIALLTASQAMALKLGATPWLGAILLDSAALDVVQIMQTKHARLYDDAFGSDPAYWRSVSPLHLLSAGAPPFLAVCSSQRNDSCLQTRRFIAKAASCGIRAQALELDLSHRDINAQLGENRGYTEAVESFMGTLDQKAMQALTIHSTGTRCARRIASAEVFCHVHPAVFRDGNPYALSLEIRGQDILPVAFAFHPSFQLPMRRSPLRYSNRKKGRHCDSGRIYRGCPALCSPPQDRWYCRS